MSVAEPTAPAHLPSNATGVAADARGHRPSLAESTTSMWAKPRQAMHQVHLPPLASGTSTFHAVLAESNEDEGIRYVENLRSPAGPAGLRAPIGLGSTCPPAPWRIAGGGWCSWHHVKGGWGLCGHAAAAMVPTERRFEV
eukprot:scaffold193485_cov32-Tisochrysis_lutea.AAC.2